MKKTSTSKSQSIIEIALNESEQRYRTTMMSVGDGVIATDTEGKVEMMNPVAEELTGWKQAEALGKSLEEIFLIINEETRKTVENPVRQVMREGIVVGLANHSVLIARDGCEHPIADSGSPIRNEKDDITGVVLVFRDQTLERIAQKTLQESERKFRETVKYLDEGYYSVTIDGLLLDHNQAFNRILGFDIAKDMKGAKLPDFWQNPDERKDYLQELMTSGFIRDYQINAKKLDGEKVVVMANSHIVKDEEGRLVRIEGTFNDFTKLKLTEEALKGSEAKYRTLFENAQVGMYRSKIDGSALLAVNRTLCEIFGCTEQEMLDNPASIRWADPAARGRMVENLRKNGSLQDYEMDILTKNAEIRNLSISVNLYPEQGFLEGSAIDITERKRADLALRASEKRFRIAAGSLTDVVYEWDLKEKVDWFGDIDRIMGYPTNGFPRTLSGWAAKLHPEDVENVMGTIEGHLKRSEPYVCEYRVMDKKGEWHWWSARGTALRDKQNIPYWWIGSITDITERKLADEVIKNNEKRFKELIESLPQLFWTCRVDGPCDYLSKQWVEYTGVPEAEQLGYRWLEQLHPEDKDRTVSEWMEKVKTGDSFDIEFRIRRNDGVFRWFKTRAVPMRDSEGNIIKWFGSNTDFDEIKKAEEQLRKLNRIYSLLSDINQTIVRTRVPEELFEKVCKIAVEQGGFGMAWIGLIDEPTQKLQVIAKAGRTNGYPAQVDISLNGDPLSYCPVDTALRQGKHIICNMIDSAELAPCQKIVYKLGFRSSASFPLKVSEIMKGVLTFYSDEPEFFDEEELKLLEELALDISFAMEYSEKETKRKHAEIMLREEKDRIRTILDLVGDPIFVKDNDHRVTLANRAFYDIFCLDENSVIGYTLVEAVPENERHHFLKVDRKVLDTGIPDLREEELTVRDLTRTIITRKTRFVDESGKRFLVGSIHDITQRKQAEQKLQESEAKYRTLVENIPQKIFMKNRDYRWMSINENFAHDLGISPEEVVGKLDIDLFPKELADKYHADDVRIITTEKTEEIEEKYEVEGKETWVNTIKTPVRDEKGEIVGLLGIFWDITGRKLAEEEIRKLNMELEDRVVLRTAQLESTNKELEAFSYSVSHDLRAPLRHVSGYVELLNKHFQSELPEKGQHYLNSISDSVHIMGMLIDDLLQFSRTGRMEMHQSDCDMNEIVKEVIDSQRKDNPDRKIDWVIGKLPSVFGDEAMLRLVWMNLLSNAVKFTRPRKKARIEIGVSKEKKELVFFVLDNGVGFDMQYAQKLFGVFQRLHPTEEFEGTGIGLANVQRIVLRHGGRTWAEAEPDKGAVFYFSIPNK